MADQWAEGCDATGGYAYPRLNCAPDGYVGRFPQEVGSLRQCVDVECANNCCRAANCSKR